MDIGPTVKWGLPFAIRQNEKESAVVSSTVSKRAWKTAVVKKALKEWAQKEVATLLNEAPKVYICERQIWSRKFYLKRVNPLIMPAIMVISVTVAGTWFNFPNNLRNSRSAFESLINYFEETLRRCGTNIVAKVTTAKRTGENAIWNLWLLAE